MLSWTKAVSRGASPLLREFACLTCTLVPLHSTDTIDA